MLFVVLMMQMVRILLCRMTVEAGIRSWGALLSPKSVPIAALGPRLALMLGSLRCMAKARAVGLVHGNMTILLVLMW